MPSMHLSRLRNWFLASPPAEYAITSLKELLIGALQQGPVPQHVAFVMDGNRRFARSHGIETVEGHNLGFEALARILEVCYKSGVKVVTIYAFSIENFKRSKFEVDALMEMAKVKLSQMAQHGDLLDRYGAKVRVLGRLDMLKPDVLEAVNKAVDMTSRNGDRILNICFPYTSRDEITSAIRDTVEDYTTPIQQGRSAAAASRFSESHIADNIRAQTLGSTTHESHSDSESTSGSSAQDDDAFSRHDYSDRVYGSMSSCSSSTTLHLGNQQDPKGCPPPRPATEADSPVYISPENISRQTLNDHMLTKDAPPLDILIRTSGVERLSDFMLWQTHENTEIVFLDVMWPEFDLWHFLPVMLGWQRRISKSRQDPNAEGNFAGDAKSSEEGPDAMLWCQAGKVKDI
ncbi:Prenyltransferase, putative [Penicillium digitatum]|uniref:Prenyltransferase, putative n=3 Tax=Penicillium digitatum TaxID=36651 RepID=K9F6E4_PEND2|nr:Prenyltransferase, putative [Penicillium digitatum Pd1]EKV04644.1 Prenyltransferase, putative [Penicillium digitatum PHI26]EKV16825.1 Prenyltransferase, putative [Penicillium digitatum Pd1]QQK45853.1 Prenyltransferase, putative [Penicillium digitatum]